MYRILAGKPERKRKLEDLGQRREGNIKMDLTEIGWVSVNWIPLAHDRGW
jgi:hypothetical protein